MKHAIGFILIALSVALGGCSKGGSDANTNATATTGLSNYTLSNGQCYNSAGQVVDGSNCANISNYYSVNGYCYNTYGEYVNPSYCNNTQYMNLTPRQCNGQFYTPHHKERRPVRCDGRNCRGNFVYDQTGRPYYCQ